MPQQYPPQYGPQQPGTAPAGWQNAGAPQGGYQQGGYQQGGQQQRPERPVPPGWLFMNVPYQSTNHLHQLAASGNVQKGQGYGFYTQPRKGWYCNPQFAYAFQPYLPQQ